MAESYLPRSLGRPLVASVVFILLLAVGTWGVRSIRDNGSALVTARVGKLLPESPSSPARSGPAAGAGLKAPLSASPSRVSVASRRDRLQEKQHKMTANQASISASLPPSSAPALPPCPAPGGGISGIIFDGNNTADAGVEIDNDCGSTYDNLRVVNTRGPGIVAHNNRYETFKNVTVDKASPGGVPRQ